MGLCQPSADYIVNVKKYNSSDQYLQLTIGECVNLLKAQNSNFDLFYFDPYNYPYIIGGFALPSNITDLYFINEEKYTTYINLVGARGENNGTGVNVLNTSMTMYTVYQDGTRLIGAGVSHNFTSQSFDGSSYRIASGNYQYPYILYTSRSDINIYINDNLQLPFVNATEEIYKIGTPSGLIDISKYNNDYPVSSVAYNDWQSYVVPGNYISIDSWTPQTIALKYGRIEFGSDGYGYINIRDNDGNIIAEQHGILTWVAGNKIYIIAGICEQEQRGRIGVFIEPPSYTATGVGWNSRSVDRKAYEFITQNKLGVIIKVNYVIPEGNYQYCKLTYKKDKQPESVNDGTIIDIDATQSECTIEGLEENNNYWFAIYTDKNESPPFNYTVEEF